MKILTYKSYMSEFDIIKIFCINYFEYMKNLRKITVVFYNNDYLKIQLYFFIISIFPSSNNSKINILNSSMYFFQITFLKLSFNKQKTSFQIICPRFWVHSNILLSLRYLFPYLNYLSYNYYAILQFLKQQLIEKF